jgi:DNA-binding transcriptional LysR family regulator
MELRQLRFFVAVAEELHFRKAAERCYIAQPALSQHIRRLERSLGVVLFERGGRAISLTAAGRALQEDARRILTQCDRAAARAARAGQGEHGTISIGYAPLTAYGALRELLQTCNRALADVRAELYPAGSTAPAALANGDLDIALTSNPLVARDLASRLYLCEPLVLAGIAGGPLMCARDPARIGELDGAPMVILDRSRFPLTGELLDTCRTMGISPHVVAEVPDLDALAMSLVTQRVLAVVPTSVARMWSAIDVAIRTFAADDGNSAVPRLRVHVTWRTGDRSPVVGRVLDALTFAERDNGQRVNGKSVLVRS